MGIGQYYGNPSEMKSMPTQSEGKRTQTTISYRDKEVNETIPENAIIKSIENNVTIQEIENGYIKTTNVYTHYCIPEKDGDMEDKWNNNTKSVYMKDRPTDAILNYGL